MSSPNPLPSDTLHVAPAPGLRTLGDTACGVQPAEDFRWFKEEVQPHESTLRRWLRSRFPHLGDLDDLIQEAYAKLFTAHKSGKILRPRNYLFTTARNVALDTIRHAKVIPFEPLEDNARLDVLHEETGVAESVSRTQELQILREAIATLPDRCRQVFTLRKLYGLSHAEISQRLAISPKTVEVQINAAMRHCAAYLRQRGLP